MSLFYIEYILLNDLFLVSMQMLYKGLTAENKSLHGVTATENIIQSFSFVSSVHNEHY